MNLLVTKHFEKSKRFNITKNEPYTYKRTRLRLRYNPRPKDKSEPTIEEVKRARKLNLTFSRSISKRERENFLTHHVFIGKNINILN